MIPKSADAVTALVTLPVTVTASLLDTLAVLVMLPPLAGAVTERKINGAGHTPKPALLHVTTPALLLQVQPVPSAPLYAVPAGNVSVTLTFVAVLGPAFDTAIV